MHVGDVVERGQSAAARHVHRDRGRMARDEAYDVAGEEPRVEVVVAAGSRPDDDPDLPALVEVFNRIGGGRARRKRDPRRPAGTHDPPIAAEAPPRPPADPAERSRPTGARTRRDE